MTFCRESHIPGDIYVWKDLTNGTPCTFAYLWMKSTSVNILICIKLHMYVHRKFIFVRRIFRGFKIKWWLESIMYEGREIFRMSWWCLFLFSRTFVSFYSGFLLIFYPNCLWSVEVRRREQKMNTHSVIEELGEARSGSRESKKNFSLVGINFSLKSLSHEILIVFFKLQLQKKLLPSTNNIQNYVKMVCSLLLLLRTSIR